MRRLVIALLLVLIPVAAHGLVLATVSLSDLFAAADHVAIVDVVGRRVLEDGCGVVSVGRVAHALKAVDTETLEFGYHGWHEPGQRYLLFLTRRGRVRARIMSTSGFVPPAEKEYRTRCATVHTVSEVMYYGFGAVKIVRSPAFAGDWAALLPREGVRVGTTLTCKIHDQPEFTWRRDFVSAAESEIVRALLAAAGNDTADLKTRPMMAGHDVTFRNASDEDVAVFARQYDSRNYNRDDTSIAKDRPNRAAIVQVPARGAATLRLRDFDGGSVTWSARPLTSEVEMCAGGIELPCAADAFEVDLARGQCPAR
jgi:hypothetical protein